MELPDSVLPGRRNGRASAPAGAIRCRQILDDLLVPLWPEDAARWADSLVDEFGSLPAVLAAGPTAQRRVLGDRQDVTAYFQAVRTAMVHCLRVEVAAGPVLSDSQSLIDYLSLDMAYAPVEQFRVLYLNAQNQLIDESVVAGTVSEAPVYPREIMRRALELGATALLLAHNHPSGDPTPSQNDIGITLRIADAGQILDIALHDHVIVARTGWTSLRAMGLLPAPGP